jgi:hypothetical protein
MVSYGFSFSTFLQNIDFTMLSLAALFVILFAFFYFSLSKIFKSKNKSQDKALSAVVAIALSAVVVAWVARSGFNIADFWNNLGISSDILYILLPLLIIAGLVFMATKLKFGLGGILLIIGLLLIVLTFTNFIYEKGFSFVAGLIFSGIGIWLLARKGEGKDGKKTSVASILVGGAILLVLLIIILGSLESGISNFLPGIGFAGIGFSTAIIVAIGFFILFMIIKNISNIKKNAK